MSFIGIATIVGIAAACFLLGRHSRYVREQIDSALASEKNSFFWILVKVLLIVLVVAALATHAPPQLLVLAALGVLVVLWYREFAGLMDMREETFPGRHDKIVWAVFLIALPPVGAPVFWFYRQSRWAEAKRVQARQVGDWA
jgi:hypothetical protein